MTTSIGIYRGNEEIVRELIRTKELSRVINEFLKQYAETKGISTKSKDDEIAELKRAIAKKIEQYDALKKEVIE